MMAAESKDEISIKEIFLQISRWIKFLLSKWVLIVAAGLIGGIIGFVYASFQKVTYTATVSFALEEDKGVSGGGLGGLASQFGFDLGSNGGGAFAGNNLMELLKSRSLVEKTLLKTVTVNGARITLVQMYIDLNKSGEVKENPELARVSFPSEPDRSKFSLQQDSLLGIIYKNIVSGQLSVSPNDKKSTITNISVESESQLFAKLFVESLVQEVSSFYIQTKSKRAQTNVDILERQADSVRRELNLALIDAAHASDNVFNLNQAISLPRVATSKKQIDVQANTVILSELVKNLVLAKVNLQKETPLIQVIDTPIMPLPKQKMSRLKTMLSIGFLFGFLMIASLIAQRWWKKNMV